MDDNNTELEEGEACYYKDDDDDNTDLDSLSYIDERIQHVLGHFQKDFEGGVSAENLGSKFGGYGSFLPTYERSHPKTPQGNQSSPQSPIVLHKEAVPDNRKAPSNMAPAARIGNTSHSSNSFRDVRAASIDVSVKKDSGISSNDVAGRCTLKDDTPIKKGNSTDQRPLKFRLKMNSNFLEQKTAEIYSGLGLDDSPSSSMENSPVESEGTPPLPPPPPPPPVSKAKAEDSAIEIIKAMTSFAIPGGVLLSPLPESLLFSVKNKKDHGDVRYMSSRSCHQEPRSMSTDESDSLVADGHSKKRIVRIVRQKEKKLEAEQINDTLSASDMALHVKKRLGNRTPDCNEFLSIDMKSTPLSSSICDAGEAAVATAKAFNVSKKFGENGVQGRKVSVETLKEESLESISGQDFKKIENQSAGNGFRKTVLEEKLENSLKDSSADPKNDRKCNAYSISKNVERDAGKCKIDKKYETPKRVKVVSEGRSKSKGDESPGKPESVARKDSFGGANSAMVSDKGSARNKMIKTKVQKDNKVRDSSKGSLKEKNSDQKIDDFPGNSAVKTSKSNNNNEIHTAFGAKVKERPSGNKVVNHSLAGPRKTDDLDSFPIAENNAALEMIPTAVAAPQLIAEDWVACDRCQQWRLLPTGLKPEQLPEKWLCVMLNWLPGMNSCDFSEDETTKALYASYQVPISEGQNNLQMHASETAFGVTSADASQFGLNHKKSNSNVLLDQGKKKPVFKEKIMLGKLNAQASGKNRNLNQHSTDSKPMKMKHPSRSNNTIEERHVSEEREKQTSEGTRKYIKLKRKTDADQSSSGTPKKSKTEHVPYADKQPNPGTGLGKVVLNARGSLPTKSSRKEVRNYDEFGLPIDDEDSLPVPEKKEGDQAEVTSGVGLLTVQNSSKNGSLRKKRKFNDWPDDETEKHNSSNSLHGDKQCGEQGSTSKLRKENQYKISNKEESLVAEGDDKLRKGRVRRVSLPGSRDQMTVETEGRYVDNDYQPTKRRKSIASHQAFDGIAPLGSGRQLAFAATSSSSKVSGSHKVRTNFDDVKGSPVESVTSSPLRSSNLDKHVLTARHISVKDGAVKVSHSSRRGANNGEGKLSLKLKGDKISNNAHPAPHKLTSTEYQVKEAKDNKVRVQAKTSEEHDNSGARHEEKVGRNNRDELSGKKPDKMTSLQSMEKNKRSGSQVGTDKMKVLTSESCFSKNGERHDSQVDPIGTETSYDAKYRSPMSKCEIGSVSQKSALRHGSTETGKQTELKQKDFEKSVMKMDPQRCTGSTRKGMSQQNVTKDAEEENKANHVGTESRDRKSKVLLSADDEIKRETLAVPRYQKGDISNEDPAYAGNSGLTKLVKNSVDSSGNVLVNCSSGSVAPGQQLTVSSPVRTSAQQTAVDTLEDATKQKDMADHYKNSGFDFESNETYFEAGLKFLHGGYLLESCHNEISKYGEMSQMQIYATAAKLFKSCAHEYESRQEMAAAALAYKCMEVAYMRVVYCKHSSTNRDRCELQSTLQVVSQGESPSSSASDVDNLNNHVAMDKATLPKVTNAHVAGNHVISVRTRPSLLRLLDFTQDINFAMEAATKSHSTFSAANATMEETRNRDCITSIKRVIDFSFQDVGELVRLVRNATKAISGAGLGGARD